MTRRVLVVAVAIVFMGGVAAFTQWRPERLTASTRKEAIEVQRKLDQEKEITRGKTAEANEALAQAETKPAAAPKPAETKPAETKPAEAAKPAEAKPGDANVFKVKFECSNGTFVVECHRDWAPLGSSRFEELVKKGFYNECRFFRVVPGFVVQFGISGDPAVTKEWRTNRIKDDPVTQSNTAGMLTFATSGANTRTTQLFISLADNKRLDGMGFSAFGKVVEGFDVVKQINPDYGEQPLQPRMEGEGNAYLQKNFPKLDYIKTATIVP